MEAYHSQLTIAPSISSSGLRTIENKSPLHYWATSYLNPDRVEDDDDTEAMILGRAAHTLLLGEDGFRDDYVIRPDKYENDDGDWKPWNGNATVCKEWLAARKSEGKTVLLKSQVEAINGIAEQLSRNRDALDLLRGRHRPVNLGPRLPSADGAGYHVAGASWHRSHQSGSAFIR
jgi:hypothetical protein